MDGDRICHTIACGTANPKHNGYGFHRHNDSGLQGQKATQEPWNSQRSELQMPRATACVMYVLLLCVLYDCYKWYNGFGMQRVQTRVAFLCFAYLIYFNVMAILSAERTRAVDVARGTGNHTELVVYLIP